MKLYVSNLPYRATGDDLEEWFAERGVIVHDVKIIQDRETQESRGFGFVEADDKHAMDCDGEPMMGRRLTISEARPQPGREQRAERYARR